MKRYIKNPFAEQLRTQGCIVQITEGEGANERVVDEYVRTPEDVARANRSRAEYLEGVMNMSVSS